jgi:hypothetical protein
VNDWLPDFLRLFNYEQELQLLLKQKEQSMSHELKLGDPVSVKTDGSANGDAIASLPLLYVVRQPASPTSGLAIGPRVDGDGGKLRHGTEYWNFDRTNVTSLKVLTEAELEAAIAQAAVDLRADNVKAAAALVLHTKEKAAREEKERAEKEAKEAILGKLSKNGRGILELFQKKKDLFGCQHDQAIEFFGALTGDDLPALLGSSVMKAS